MNDKKNRRSGGKGLREVTNRELEAVNGGAFTVCIAYYGKVYCFDFEE